MSSRRQGFNCGKKRKVVYKVDGSVIIYSDTSVVEHNDDQVENSRKFCFTVKQENY